MKKVLRFAVMGAPITNSLSPLIHYCFAKQTGIRLRYDKLYVEQDDFKREMQSFFALGGAGLNITSPLKGLAYQFSDVQSKRCQLVKSANTLWFKENKIYADNTDGQGFILDLQNYISVADKTILIIGAGGAARGIIPDLLALKPQSIAILNRTQESAFRLINNFTDKVILADTALSYDIIINATASNGDICRDKQIERSQFCYDLRYAYIGGTPFSERAVKLGVQAKNGLGMLINQAALSFEIWHGVRPSTNILTHVERDSCCRY